MDSLTQIVLGAAVGEAALGKKVGNRAMLWGAVAGTIPDFDVLIKFFTDAVTATEMHRGFSHSILFSLIFAPIFGYLIKKHEKLFLAAFSVVLVSVFFLNSEALLGKVLSISLLSMLFYGAYRLKEVKVDVSARDWTKLMFLSLITHPILDNHTTWGTQFFWPFDYRIAFKNIFVVDPLYTLPFLVFTLIALFHKRTNPRRRMFNNIGLIVSTTYMVLSFVLKGISYSEFQEELDNSNIDYIEMDTKPTPLNTILWNAQVETKTGYRVAYYSFFDSKKIQFSEEIPKNYHLLEPYKDQKEIKQLINIAAGWYIMEEMEGKLFFVDLRFGQIGFNGDSPFMWRYELTPDGNGKVKVKQVNARPSEMGGMFKSLWERMGGN